MAAGGRVETKQNHTRATVLWTVPASDDRSPYDEWTPTVIILTTESVHFFNIYFRCVLFVEQCPPTMIDHPAMTESRGSSSWRPNHILTSITTPASHCS